VPRGGRPMPLEDMATYYRGARYALLAMKRRHPADAELQEDADRYIAMLDGYSKAAVETYRMKRNPRPSSAS
jgi:hypothetical protein